MGVVAVEAWTVRFALRHPVVFESMRFTDRDYTVVRLTDADGAQGLAYGMARNAPVTAAVDAIAGLVLGADPWHAERLWNTLYAATIVHGQRGVSLRAISLVEIALWDLRARALGVPLSHLLGGDRDELEVSVGGGYYRERREPADVAEELARYVREGYRHVKIPAGGRSPVEEERWVGAAREAVGSDVALALDTHWTWQTVPEAVRVLERLEQFRLDWVEDPLWPEALVAAAELRRRVRVPLAIGDEQSGRWAYQNMLALGAADLWRVDVTVVGGISELRRIAAIAAGAGVQLATHIYPELHVHLAAAERGILGVEYVEPDADIDLSHRFVHPVLVPTAGRVRVPTTPGLGVDLDWELIEGSATERVRRR